MSNSNPQSFVVLSDGMGKWRKGDVLAGSVLREAGADITRLLALKAIREATIHEAGSAHVEILSDGDRHLSQNHQVAEKEAEIARLTGRIASLEEQLATATDKIIRYREDQVDPTASVGMPLGDLSIYEVGGEANLSNIKFIGIEAGKTHKLRVSYYG
jgi:hypothetical protein